MSGKILIVTGEHDSTADLMVLHLRGKGAAFERFHPQDIPRSTRVVMRHCSERSPVGYVCAIDGSFDWSEIKSVWYRRPEPYRLSDKLSSEQREFAYHECTSVMLGMWRTFDAFWVNHPDKIRVAESKPLQLTVAQKLGFDIPTTLFTNDPKELSEFFDAANGNVVYKSMTQGVLGKSNQQSVYTTRLRREHIDKADLLKNSPGLFQEEIAKICDLRITVIGSRVFPVEIHSQSDAESLVDWRRGEVPRMNHVPHELPRPIERLCLELTRGFELHYSAIDMILTPKNEYVFLEINPSGQFGWIQSITGLPLIETLADLLMSHT